MVKRIIEDWPTKELNAKAASGEIDLDTEYQREIIWTKKAKELLIDSILNEMDIPKLYLAKFTAEREKIYECIDGKQRINSVMEFCKGKISDLKKRKYVELNPEERKKFDEYKFTVGIIIDPDDDYINELFRRLNLGDPLNTAERLHSMTGAIRNFVFETIGANGPLIGKTNLSSKRFSRELAVAQLVFNSTFFRNGEEFKRARWEDLNKFFEAYPKFSAKDETNTAKIKKILQKIDDVFGDRAEKISSRASLVSAYLFAEKLVLEDKMKDLKIFVKFYLRLWDRIVEQNQLIRRYEAPNNRIILERFYKNVQQASVEPYSIKRRQEFLDEAFEHFKETGKIIVDDQKK